MFGFSKSKSSSSGAPVASSDTHANNNAGANAPIINFNDTRKGSGERFIQEGNSLKVVVNQEFTDYGAIDKAVDLSKWAVSSNEAVAKKAIDTNYLVSSDAMDLVQSSMVQSYAMTAKSFDAIESNLRNALDFVEGQATPDHALVRDVSESLIWIVGIAGAVWYFGSKK